jgi:hypothetical protein
MKNYYNYEKIRKTFKNPKVKTAGVLSAGLAVFLFILWFAGLFATPGNYRPVKFVFDGQVSRYLTNYILPELYNKSQFDQPFDVVFSQQGINDIIARQIDPNSLRRSNISDLSVAFKRNRVLLTGKTTYRGFNFIVTIVLKPYINKKGYLFFRASKVQVGQSRIPFAAEVVKRKILYGLAGISDDADTANFVGILFNRGQMEPVFSFNKRNLRIAKITVRKEKLTIQFKPE